MTVESTNDLLRRAEEARGQGDWLAAAQRYLRVVLADPNRDDLLAPLLRCVRSIDRPDLAVKACVEILKIRPSCANAHFALGLTFGGQQPIQTLAESTLTRQADVRWLALRHLRRAVQLRPCAEMMGALAVELLHQSHHDEAAEILEHTITRHPTSASLRQHRGRLHLELGNLRDAITDYQAALELDPAAAVPRWELAKIDRSADRAGELLAIGMALTAGNPDPKSRATLHFAAATHHDRLDDVEAPWKHYQKGNRIKPQPSAEEKADQQHRWQHELIRRTSVAKSFQSGIADVGDRPRPIFIVSLPRCGSTLIETLLSTPGEVHGGGERLEVSDLAATLPKRLSTEAPYPDCIESIDDCIAKQMIDEYARAHRTADWVTDKI